jgi:hypothetical protein
MKFKSVAIIHLKQQIAAYRTSIKKQDEKITDLEDEFELSCNLITIDRIPFQLTLLSVICAIVETFIPMDGGTRSNRFHGRVKFAA